MSLTSSNAIKLPELLVRVEALSGVPLALATSSLWIKVHVHGLDLAKRISLKTATVPVQEGKCNWFEEFALPLAEENSDDEDDDENEPAGDTPAASATGPSLIFTDSSRRDGDPETQFNMGDFFADETPPAAANYDRVANLGRSNLTSSKGSAKSQSTGDIGDLVALPMDIPGPQPAVFSLADRHSHRLSPLPRPSSTGNLRKSREALNRTAADIPDTLLASLPDEALAPISLKKSHSPSISIAQNPSSGDPTSPFAISSSAPTASLLSSKLSSSPPYNTSSSSLPLPLETTNTKTTITFYVMTSKWFGFSSSCLSMYDYVCGIHTMPVLTRFFFLFRANDATLSVDSLAWNSESPLEFQIPLQQTPTSGPANRVTATLKVTFVRKYSGELNYSLFQPDEPRVPKKLPHIYLLLSSSQYINDVHNLFYKLCRSLADSSDCRPL